MRKKGFRWNGWKLAAAAGMLTMLMTSTAFAAGWTQGAGENASRWWYDLGNGRYYGDTGLETEWQWLDGNGDGMAECYAFDGQGWMYADTETPDGYSVNGDGAWTVDGNVQTMAAAVGYAGTRAALPSDGAETGSTDAAETGTDQEDGTPRILIAYFSKTGNTEEAARQIQSVTDGDLFEITVAEPYPDSYQATVERARQELDSNARPALSSTVESMEDYDVILVGYPIWWHTEPMAINTFLESYDLAGKMILPFCTSGGSGIEESMPDMRRIGEAQGAVVGTGLTANSLDEGMIASWLQENGINL